VTLTPHPLLVPWS